LVRYIFVVQFVWSVSFGFRAFSQKTEHNKSNTHSLTCQTQQKNQAIVKEKALQKHPTKSCDVKLIYHFSFIILEKNVCINIYYCSDLNLIFLRLKYLSADSKKNYLYLAARDVALIKKFYCNVMTKWKTIKKTLEFIRFFIVTVKRVSLIKNNYYNFF
jgi:hypothetical protein